MTCDRCGMPCHGALCKECERVERQRGIGTPAENREQGVDDE